MNKAEIIRSILDTLSIEENYLADGLARGALATVEAAQACEEIELRDFAPDDPIDIGALVEVQFTDGKDWFFVSPAGGGTEVKHQGRTVTVLTPESPLGSQLLDRKAGEAIASPKAKILSVV